MLVLLAGRGHVALARPRLSGHVVLRPARLCSAAQPVRRCSGRSIPPVTSILRDDGSMAEGSLPVTILRSPDTSGPGGGGRYLVVVNSGYGVQLRADANEGQQLLQVVDLARDARACGRAGGVFPVAAERQRRSRVRDASRTGSGAWPLYVSGGFENRIWRLTLHAGRTHARSRPAHGLDDGPLKADAIELAGMAPDSADSTYNNGREPLYPTGLAISSDGRELYVANNLGDSLGIVRDPDAPRPRAARASTCRPPSRGGGSSSTRTTCA